MRDPMEPLTSDTRKIPDRIKALPAALRESLARIEPSVDEPTLGNRVRYFPCDVVLADASEVRHVYLVDAAEYIGPWGSWPWEDRGKQWLPVESIASLTESRDRLPANLANELYRAGESGMGCQCFAVEMSSGRCLFVETGGTVDFIDWPRWARAGDAVAVKPHLRRVVPLLHRTRPHTLGEPCWWAPFRSCR